MPIGDYPAKIKGADIGPKMRYMLGHENTEQRLFMRKGDMYDEIHDAISRYDIWRDAFQLESCCNRKRRR